MTALRNTYKIMKVFFKYIIVFFAAMLFAGAIIIGYFVNEFFIKKPAAGAAPIAFTIEKGASAKKVSKDLRAAGIIDNVFVFEIYVRLIRAEDIFQPGDYKFFPGENINAIVKEMTAINIKENKFTLIEGWTLKDIAKYLADKKFISRENDLYYLTGRPATDYRKTRIDFAGGWEYDFLADKPAYAGLEGYVYPDTYRVLTEAGVRGLLKKSLDNFDKKLTPELRVEIRRQGKTIFEVVIMASVVEKEVRGYEDRRLAADLFWRRLKMGMPLGADSTINYITGSGRARSTYDDLKIDSPWNTYKYAGLPLGPISNPSIEAIRATIYPAANNYLYFLTDKEGAVHFAKTAAEHSRNRAKYLE